MKIIAVWGVPGGGKSLVSLAIAHYITNEMKKNTILISADRTSPMFSTFLPTKEYSKNNSLGVFLDNSITKENLTGKIHRQEKNKFLAFMSMGDGDSFQRYTNSWPVNKLKEMMYLLSEYADYLILDLTSNFIVDNFSLFGIEYADLIVDVFTADNKSTSFFNTYKTLLYQDSRYSKQKHIKLLNNYYEYSGYREYMKDFEIEYGIPNCRQLYEGFITASDNMLAGKSKMMSEIKEVIKNILKEVE